MREAIGVLNAGSSSLKFCVYEAENQELTTIVRGQIESIDRVPKFKAKDGDGSTLVEKNISFSGAFTHAQAFHTLADWLRDSYAQRYKLVAVGHRIVHGGSEFVEPTVITPQVLEELEKLIPLAPLHLPYNLDVVKAIVSSHPHLLQAGCFDTAFHQGRELVTQRFGLPDELFQRGARRWGFHGLSYEWIASKFREIAPSIISGKAIVAHLGNGASLCAMRNGKCVDTTMSFSTLDGLPMGTRCGSLDPGVILWLLRSMSPKEIEDLLYHRSGLLGLSGLSNDVRELLASSDARAKHAIEYFVYRIAREIGSLTSALGGLDALIFTAGIGENSPVIRQYVCELLGWLGIAIEDNLNARNEECITPRGRSPSVWVIPTNEEKVIAEHAQSLRSRSASSVS